MRNWLFLIGFFALLMPFGLGFTINSVDINALVFANKLAFVDVNLSNDNIAKTLNIKLYDNGNFKNSLAKGFTTDENALLRIEWMPSNTGTHSLSIIAENPATLETKEYNKQVNVGTWSDYDFSILASDIDLNGNAIVGKTNQVSATIKNLGNTDKLNVTVRAYRGQETTSTLLTSQIIGLPAQGFTRITFDYTPVVSGVDAIIVIVDPNNEVMESNESNNRAEKAVSVSQTETGSLTYATTLYLRAGKEDCIVVMNNNDKFYFKEIVPDANASYVKFDLLDSTGATIFSANGYTNNEFIKPSRTIKVINVNETIATLVLIYSFANNISYSTCETNIAELSNSLNKCELDYETLVQTCRDDGIEKMNCITNKANLDVEISACKTEVGNLTITKGVCDLSLTQITNDCNARVGAVSLSEKELCGSLVLQKDTIIATKDGYAMQSDIVAATGWLTAIGLAITMIVFWHKGILTL